MSTTNSHIVKGEEEEEEEEELFFSEAENDSDDAGATTRQMDFGARLERPLTQQYCCGDLFNSLVTHQIDLEADYQREVVWTEMKQSMFIDSVYRNYYIPPILFSKRPAREGDEGEQIKVCIDGKQRLTSILRFMKNEIPMREPKTGRKFYYMPKGGTTRCIGEARRNNFLNAQLTCTEYDNLTEDIEREMFHRVQLGMHLSSGEKLNAAKGDWADFARELMKRLFELAPPTDSPKDKPWNKIVSLSRGKDFLLMAYSCLLYIHRDDRRYVPSTKALEDLFKNEEEPPTDTQRQELIGAVVCWAKMANSDTYKVNLFQFKGASGRSVLVAPVEFLFCIFMCHRFPGATDRQLSDLFGQMRTKVRSEHKDIMINNKLEGTIRAFLFDVERQHPSYLASSATGSRRRPRDDDDDDEWIPPARIYSRLRVD